MSKLVLYPRRSRNVNTFMEKTRKHRFMEDMTNVKVDGNRSDALKLLFESCAIASHITIHETTLSTKFNGHDQINILAANLLWRILVHTPTIPPATPTKKQNNFIYPAERQEH